MMYMWGCHKNTRPEDAMLRGPNGGKWLQRESDWFRSSREIRKTEEVMSPYIRWSGQKREEQILYRGTQVKIILDSSPHMQERKKKDKPTTGRKFTKHISDKGVVSRYTKTITTQQDKQSN